MQNNVNIATNENDLVVKYGMYDLCEERENARCSLKYILSDLNDIRKTYIRLGFHLHEFEKNKYYEDFGYLTFYEFCDANIGMDKGAVSRCINVFLEFNASNDISYMAGVKTVGASVALSSKYEDFSYSQLCEMLSLSDEERKKITPDMTIKEIREFKKQKKNVSQENENVSQVATSQPINEIKLCVSDLVNKKGIVLQNYIKKCDSIRKLELNLYDENGKPIYSGMICDVLMTGEMNIGKIYLRLLKE